MASLFSTESANLAAISKHSASQGWRDRSLKTLAARLKARITADIIEGQEDGTYEDMLVRSLLADLVREPLQSTLQG